MKRYVVEKFGRQGETFEIIAKAADHKTSYGIPFILSYSSLNENIVRSIRKGDIIYVSGKNEEKDFQGIDTVDAIYLFDRDAREFKKLFEKKQNKF
ncbi:MAG: hypothetical protein QW051_03795 [Candidatus Aenigmatarchaeota archaeon]